MQDTQIIILAGGKGTRMNSDCPKVLCRCANEPMIKHLLRSIEKVSLNPVIVVGYRGEDVIETLGKDYNYVRQREQLGTGHAVMCAKNSFSENSDNVVVLLGDHPLVSTKTIENLIAYHKENKPTLTLATVIAPSFEGEFARFFHYGRIIRKSDGSVEKIVELKDADEEQKQVHEVNVSYYCFDSKWLWENIERLQNKNASSEYYLTDMVGLAVEQGKKVSAFAIENPVEGFGVNTVKELEEMEKYLQ